MATTFAESFLKAKLDMPDPAADGEDRDPKGAGEDDDVSLRTLRATKAPPRHKTVVVPFPRPLKKGMKGQDVVAVKRAWRKVPPMDSLISNRTSVYGDGAVRAEQKFERKMKRPVNGVYERADHLKLMPFFDAYGAFLMAREKKVLTKPHPRELLCAAALALHNYEVIHGRVYYTQGGSRMTIVRRKITIADYARNPSIYEDCSSSVTGYFWQAGLQDPNGFGFAGWGWTGTLCEHGEVVSQPFPGDLIFYGRGAPWHHVAIAVGDDPLKPTSRCVSHGHQGGPFLADIHYRSDVGQYRSYLRRTA